MSHISLWYAARKGRGKAGTERGGGQGKEGTETDDERRPNANNVVAAFRAKAVAWQQEDVTKNHIQTEKRSGDTQTLQLVPNIVQYKWNKYTECTYVLSPQTSQQCQLLMDTASVASSVPFRLGNITMIAGKGGSLGPNQPANPVTITLLYYYVSSIQSTLTN